MNWKCTSQFEWGLVSVGHAKESLSPVVWWRELRPCCIGIILQPEFRNPLSWQAHPTFWQLVIGLRRANQEFTCLWSCRNVYNSLYNLPIYWGIIFILSFFFLSFFYQPHAISEKAMYVFWDIFLDREFCAIP